MTENEFKQQAARSFESGDFAGAAKIATEYAQDPASSESALAEFCRAFLTRHHIAEAEAILAAALDRKHDQHELQQVRIEALLTARNGAAAVELCDELIAAYPGNLDYKGIRAVALRDLGRVDDAIDALEGVLATDPINPSAHFQLSTMKKYQPDQPAFKQLMDARGSVGAMTPLHKAMLFAAVGKAFEDTGAYDDAFKAYQTFCTAYREVEPYREDAWATLTANMARIYQRGLFETETATGPTDASPIFVFGLPRSGTTLVEQVLARHSATNAIGETEVTMQVYGEWLDKWAVPRAGRPANPFTPEALEDAAAMYQTRSKVYGTGTGPRLIDKSISSYLYLGFLHYAFPNARFVHCVRNPLDVAISCFATQFGPGMAWSYDLSDIARFFRRYQKLIKHWQQHMPHKIHTVVYEDMVRDPEAQSRALLDYCNLPWEDACLHTAGDQRPIYTASVVQARQPIYTTSMGRAARFEKHLGPLKAALGKAADPNWYKS